MDYNRVATLVSTKLGKVAEVKEVQKNGKTRTAILVKSNNEGELSICPTIYLDNIIERYGEDEKVVADAVVCIVNETETPKEVYKASDVMKYEAVKDMIYPRLVNVGRVNEDSVSLPFLADTRITFRVALSDEASIVVTTKLLETWGISKYELLDVALANNEKKATYKATPMTLGMGMALDILTDVKGGVYGATGILSDKVVDDLIEKYGDNIVLIPSSVHEWIVNPFGLNATNPIDELKHLAEVICEVNNTALAYDDLLSYALFGIVDKKLVVLA